MLPWRPQLYCFKYRSTYLQASIMCTPEFKQELESITLMLGYQMPPPSFPIVAFPFPDQTDNGTKELPLPYVDAHKIF